MEIKRVSLIGLGALGVLFGHRLSKQMPEGDLRVIADAGRIERYRRDKIYCNGQECSFSFVTPEDECSPADLIIIAVKFNGLIDAVEAVKNHVGANTIILSLLNGISSEEIIAGVYGAEKVLYCVAQGMDAVREDNKLVYKDMGMLCFGGSSLGELSSKTQAVADFFTKAGVPHLVVEDMRSRLWGKFMLNVGLNQAVAVYECDYKGVQDDGPARDTAIAAMREVITLSEKDGVNLTDKDLVYWLDVMDRLNPPGKPSMRQDMEARRCTEVEMFAGTVLEKGKKHGLAFPVNQMLYDKIKEMEKVFCQN